MTEPIRVFLDSTVHLFAYRSAKTNSSLVLGGMDADLPHICAYFAANCQYFVTSNRRLTKMEIGKLVNFKSPREFVEEVLKARPYDTPEGI